MIFIMTTRFYLRLLLCGFIIGPISIILPLTYFTLQERGGEFADGWLVAGIVGGILVSIILIRKIWLPIAATGAIISHIDELCDNCNHDEKSHKSKDGKCVSVSGWISPKPCKCEKFISRLGISTSEIDDDGKIESHVYQHPSWFKLQCKICKRLRQDHTDSMVKACLAQYQQEIENTGRIPPLFSEKS